MYLAAWTVVLSVASRLLLTYYYVGIMRLNLP